MSDKTSLGDRMKAYEQVTRAVLPQRTYAIIRVDGRAFHSYLRHADKPYDLTFAMDMEHLSQMLCKEISGAQFAYHQSDEISILATDFGTVHSQPWFGGVIQKIASSAAAYASAAFMEIRHSGDRWAPEQLPTFDARVFTIPDPVDVANYFVWRQKDAIRNSISMCAQANFSHKSLQGLNSDQMQEKLFSEKGVNWNSYPDRFKRGSIVFRKQNVELVEYTDKRTGDNCSEYALRSRWEAEAAPNFTAIKHSWLDVNIPRHRGFARAVADESKSDLDDTPDQT